MNLRRLFTSKKLLIVLIATVCLLLLGTTAFAASSFTDIVGHWAQPFIEKVAALGIMQGHNATTFGPDENVTRAQLAAIEARAYDKQAADATKLVNDKLNTNDQNLALWKIQPGLGTVMIEYGNRMARLWFAGNAGNWDMATYQILEMREIQETGEITRPNRAAPLKAFESAFLDPVDVAAKAQDKPGFIAAFNSMIAGCNGCHVASSSAAYSSYRFVKVQTPKTDPSDYIQWDAPGGTGNAK